MEGAKAAIARRRAAPGPDVISDLIRVRDGDRLSETELVTLVWQLVLGGQTPANLIANAVEALLAHPDQLAAPRADPDRLDLARDEAAHLGYAHGPHFCLGAWPARLQVRIALTALLRRSPGLAPAKTPERMPDPGTWRLASLPVVL